MRKFTIAPVTHSTPTHHHTTATGVASPCLQAQPLSTWSHPRHDLPSAHSDGFRAAPVYLRIHCSLLLVFLLTSRTATRPITVFSHAHFSFHPSPPLRVFCFIPALLTFRRVRLLTLRFDNLRRPIVELQVLRLYIYRASVSANVSSFPSRFFLIFACRFA